MKYLFGLLLLLILLNTKAIAQQNNNGQKYKFEDLWNKELGEQIDTFFFSNSVYKYMLYQKNDAGKKSNTSHYFDEGNNLLKTVVGNTTTWFYSDTSKLYKYKTITGDLKNDKKGAALYYDHHDRLYMQKNYVKNKHVSTFYFDTLGFKASVAPYKDGHRHGMCRGFYSDGVVRWQGKYKNGHMEGGRMFYDQLGNPYTGKINDRDNRTNRTTIVECINGKPQGKFITLDEDSLIAIKGDFNMGLPVDTFMYYNEGMLVRYEYYEDGKFKFMSFPFIEAQKILDSINNVYVPDTSNLGVIDQYNQKGKKQGYWKVFLDEKAVPTDSANACFYGFTYWDNGEELNKFDDINELNKVNKKHNGLLDTKFIGPLPEKGKPVAIHGMLKIYDEHNALRGAIIYKNGQPYFARTFYAYNNGEYGKFYYYYIKYKNIQGTCQVVKKVPNKHYMYWYRKGKNGWASYRYQ